MIAAQWGKTSIFHYYCTKSALYQQHVKIFNTFSIYLPLLWKYSKRLHIKSLCNSSISVWRQPATIFQCSGPATAWSTAVLGDMLPDFQNLKCIKWKWSCTTFLDGGQEFNIPKQGLCRGWTPRTDGIRSMIGCCSSDINHYKKNRVGNPKGGGISLLDFRCRW